MRKKNVAHEALEKALRDRIAKAPSKAGVYRWLNSEGTVLYIGKAKDLRKRLRSYFVPAEKRGERLGPWKEALLRQLSDVDWTITSNELEALILETNLIKEVRPKFNVLMKDDKNYVYMKITEEDLYPTLEITRQMEDPKSTYFGPFLSGYDLRSTLDLLHTVFQWRACKRSIDLLNKRKFSEEHRLASTRPRDVMLSLSKHVAGPAQHDVKGDSRLKPCIEQQIGRCNGLCTGTITQEEYRSRIEKVIQFFRGHHEEALERLQTLMQEAAEAHQFEKAAKLRDTLQYIHSLKEQQIVSGTSGADTDIFGIALLRGRAQVVLLKERDGKVVQEIGFALRGEAESKSDILAQFLPQYFSDTLDIPDTILVSESFEGQELLEEWLSEKQTGKKRVSIHVPERGKKSKLLAMADANALEKVEQQFARWEAEEARVERALQELQTALALPKLPERIECYDISHLGGTETVGSMVVALSGKPANDHYRSFTLRTIHRGEIDDYKALREVLTRRLRYLVFLEERWKKAGITFRPGRKADQEMLEAIIGRHPEVLSTDTISARDFTIAEQEGTIIGYGRLIERSGAIKEVKSVWVDEEHRGQKLGHTIVRKLVERAKRGKVYVTITPDLEEYYAQLGFQKVAAPPKSIAEALEKEKFLDASSVTVMMLEVRKGKPDISLTARPDLLVLDGGKGQLAAGLEVLRKLELSIPMISLAKREEEVFSWSVSRDCEGPIPIPEEARYLLMRLRDEAHRFANRHRERRAKHAMIA